MLNQKNTKMKEEAVVILTTKRRLFIREKKGSIMGALHPKEWIEKETTVEVDTKNLPKDSLKLLSLRVMIILHKAPKGLLFRYGRTLRMINENPNIKDHFDVVVSKTAAKVRPWLK